MNDDDKSFWSFTPDSAMFNSFSTNYTPNMQYTFSTINGTFSISQDLNAIYEKADKEFDALEDQTSIARQMLNDIGITWNDKE